MKSSINSKYYRSAGQFVEFEIDEAAINQTGARNIVPVDYIDKSKSFIDWGYANAGANFNIGNIRLTIDEYETLKTMKEDNTYTEYIFHRLDRSWPCFISDVQKTAFSGDYATVSITLLITDNPF